MKFHLILVGLIFGLALRHNVYGQWEQAPMTGGSRVSDMIQFDGALYIIMTPVGILKTVDNGYTWTQEQPEVGLGGFSFVVHKASLLAVAHSFFWKKNSGDNNWQTGIGPAQSINDVCSNGTDIYAATDNGIYKSSNDGLSWDWVGDSKTQIGLSSIVSVGSIVLATSKDEGAILKSVDNGITWEKINIGSKIISQIFIEGGKIYINVSNDGIYRSEDLGSTWNLLRKNNSWGSLDVKTSSLVYVSGYKLSIASTDEFSWSTRDYELPRYGVTCVTQMGGNIFVGTWGGGIYRTGLLTDVNWQPVNSGIYAHDVQDIKVIDDVIYAGTAYSFVKKSSDGGITWDQLKDSFGMVSGSVYQLLHLNDNLFVGLGGGGIQRSSDYGVTWVNKNPGSGPASIVNRLVASKGNLYAGTEGGLYKSEDGGDNWIHIQTGSNTSVVKLYDYKDTIYNCAWDGLFVSPDQGVTWTNISNELPTQSISDVVQIQSTLFVSTRTHGLFKTTDLGNTWEHLLDNAYVLTSRNNSLFVSNSSLWVSHDMGEHFIHIGDGLENSSTEVLSFSEDKMLVGKVFGLGLWMRSLSEIVPPFLMFSSNYSDSSFLVGESIYITSDQKLFTFDQKQLSNELLRTNIEVKDQLGVAVPFQATITEDSQLITITLTNATVGTYYWIDVNPAIRNESGQNVSAISSRWLATRLNDAPELSDIELTVAGESVSFNDNFFANIFTDINNDELEKIKILSLPQHGTLLLDEQEIFLNQEINAPGLSQIVYIPFSNYSGTDGWKWKAFDGIEYSSESSVVIIINNITDAEGDLMHDVARLTPNPFNNMVLVSINDFFSPETYLEIQVLDVHGQQVKRFSLLGELEYYLDLSELQHGIYLFLMISDRSQIVKKLVKL